MGSRWILILTAVIVGASGCLGAPSPFVPEALEAECLEDPLGFTGSEDTHEHLDLDQHRLSCEFELVSHQSMVETRGMFAGAHTVVVHGSVAAVAVRSGDVGHGFDLFDVTDPAAPILLGQFRDEQSRGGDRNIEFSADGSVVFMGVEGDEPDRAGVRAIDVSDPSAPHEVAYYPIVPFGVHTLEAFTWKGTQYVAAINFGFHLLAYQDNALGPLFRPVSRFAKASERVASHPSLSQTTISRDLYGHDVFIAEDPPSGRLYVTYSGVYEGTVIVDITEPSVPVEVMTWIPPGNEQPTVSHYSQLYYPGDGRRILITGEENFERRHADDASRIWFTDVTDPASPELLATWTNPGNHPADRILLSVHYFEVAGTNLFVAHYHGGVWRLDITDPAKPVPTGFYMPHEDTGYVPEGSCCIGYNMRGIPMVFDLTLDEGNVYAADFATGFYVLRPG